MRFTGLPALFFVVPFFIGAFICGIAGCAAGVYLITSVTDWIINRLILRFYVYSVFIKMVRTEATKRRKDAETSN